MHPRHQNFFDNNDLNWIHIMHIMCPSLYYKRQVWSRGTCLSSNTFAVKKPSFFIILKALERAWPGCSAIMSASLSGSYLLANMFFLVVIIPKKYMDSANSSNCEQTAISQKLSQMSSHRLETLITFPIWFSLGTPHNTLKLTLSSYNSHRSLTLGPHIKLI